MQYIGLNQCNRVIRTLRLRRFISSNFRTILTAFTAQKLAHTIYGPTPSPGSLPIFVLHDCLGTKKNWEIVCKQLASAYKSTVIAVDARNHGDSPSCITHDYTSLAADVSKLMSSFEINKCIIIGHSMGGRTGMVLALNEPSSVAGLVVVDISPVSTSAYLSDSFPKIIDVLMSVDFKGLDLIKAKAAAKNKIVKNQLFQKDEEIQALLMNIGELPDGSFGWKFNLHTLHDQFDKIVAFPDMPYRTYSGPTLFVAGKLSYCVPPEDLKGIHKLFPSARLVYIDGVGHNVHVEDPEGFVSAVVNSFDYKSVIETKPQL